MDVVLRSCMRPDSLRPLEISAVYHTWPLISAVVGEAQLDTRHPFNHTLVSCKWLVSNVPFLRSCFQITMN